MATDGGARRSAIQAIASLLLALASPLPLLVMSAIGERLSAGAGGSDEWLVPGHPAIQGVVFAAILLAIPAAAVYLGFSVLTQSTGRRRRLAVTAAATGGLVVGLFIGMAFLLSLGFLSFMVFAGG